MLLILFVVFMFTAAMMYVLCQHKKINEVVETDLLILTVHLFPTSEIHSCMYTSTTLD